MKSGFVGVNEKLRRNFVSPDPKELVDENDAVSLCSRALFIIEGSCSFYMKFVTGRTAKLAAKTDLKERRCDVFFIEG